MMQGPGAYRDAVILNTAAGLVIAGRTASLNEGARLAEVEIDSGKAKALLDRFVTFTQEGRTE